MLLMATALSAAGWLDYLHALSYKGMPELVTPALVQKGIAFLLAARFLVAATLLGVSFSPQMSPPSQGWRYGILAFWHLDEWACDQCGAS